MRRKRSWVALVVGLVGFAVAASAQAEVVVDASCPPPPEVLLAYFDPPGGNARVAQLFTVQNSGELVSAQVDVSKAVGSSGDYVIQIVAVDGSGAPTNTVLATATIPNATVSAGSSLVTANFPNSVAVASGQQYGVVLTRPGSANLAWGARSPDDCPGNAFRSNSQTDAFFTEPQFDLVFTTFVNIPPEVGDSSAPNTTITKGPKNKTKKKKATFEFTGIDARAIAGFQCKLDAGAFAPCTSPHTVKVKKGKHTFQVQAIDQAGNVGSPATDTWKRKKK
jgi:hypothetical protein